MKRFEAEHRARDPFDKPMILLDKVIQIFHLQDLDWPVEPNVYEEQQAWKSQDWEALNRLHEQGLFHDPVNMTKSVVLTDRGWGGRRRFFVRCLLNRRSAPPDIMLRVPAVFASIFTGDRI